MKIHVLYFAALREHAGRMSEYVQTDARSVGELYDELQNKYRLPMPALSMKAAVNREFVRMTEPLKDGDEVVFMPPVAGG